MLIILYEFLYWVNIFLLFTNLKLRFVFFNDCHIFLLKTRLGFRIVLPFWFYNILTTGSWIVLYCWLYTPLFNMRFFINNITKWAIAYNTLFFFFDTLIIIFFKSRICLNFKSIPDKLDFIVFLIILFSHSVSLYFRLLNFQILILF